MATSRREAASGAPPPNSTNEPSPVAGPASTQPAGSSSLPSKVTEAQWYFSADLQFAPPAPAPAEPRAAAPRTVLCSWDKCPKDSAQTQQLSCSECSMPYCSRACQTRDWKEGPHKSECKVVSSLALETRAKKDSAGQTPAASLSAAALEAIGMRLKEIGTYVSAFNAAHTDVQGSGMIVVRTASGVSEMAYGDRRDVNGRRLNRSLEISFLTLDEFDSMILERDFELASARPFIEKALPMVGRQAPNVLVVVLTGCGAMAVGVLPVQPSVRVAAALGKAYEFANSECFEIKLDTRDDDDQDANGARGEELADEMSEEERQLLEEAAKLNRGQGGESAASNPDEMKLIQSLLREMRN